MFVTVGTKCSANDSFLISTGSVPLADAGEDPISPSNGAEAFGPVWTVENAGPHMDWRE